MSTYFLKLCWKNLWRNRRRTLITANAIAVGVMALVAIYNYYDSFHEQLIHNVIRYHSGHLLVTAPGYSVNNAPGKYLKNSKPLESWLAKQMEVRAFSSRILVQGLISSPKGSANLILTGIEPEREKKVTRFATNMVKGDYFESESKKPMVIGRALAKQLKLGLGDKAVVLTQGVDGSIGNELFFITGIFETHSDMDKSMAFVRKSDARSLLSISSKTAAHQVAVVLKEESHLPLIYDRLVKNFPKPQAETLTWKDVQRPLMALIALNKSANRLLMGIILFISALGIANSILMSILERTREFGVMLAMGTSKKEVIKMVITETVLLSLVGVFLGNILGIAVTEYFHSNGFDLKWLTSQPIMVQGTIVQTVSYPKVQWLNSVLVSAVIVFLSFVVSFLPVRHVANLNVVKALRAN